MVAENSALSCLDGVSQKIHNAKLALEQLGKDGVSAASGPSAVSAHDVVDGNREGTLRLVWSILTRYALATLLDRDALAREVEGLVAAEREGRQRQSEWSPVRLSRGAGAMVEPAAAGGKGHPPLEMPDVGTMSAKSRGIGGGARPRRGCERYDDMVQALLVWCQAVCHRYGVRVVDFTTSFADGRALCLLLHYYDPAVSSGSGNDQGRHSVGVLGSERWTCELVELAWRPVEWVCTG